MSNVKSMIKTTQLAFQQTQVKPMRVRWIALVLCFCLIALVPIDWIFSTELYSGVSRDVPHIIRAIILGTMLIYYFLSHPNPGEYGFTLGCPIALFAVLMFFYAILQSNTDIITANLFTLFKSFFWMLGVIVFYRLIISGSLSSKDIFLTVSLVVFLASIFTIYYCLFADIEKRLNANAYLLTYCMPFLFLNNRSKLSIFLIILADFAILITLKRGAIFALLVSLIAYWLMLFKINHRFRSVVKNNFSRLIMLVAVTTIVIIWQRDNIALRMEDLIDPDKMGSYRGLFYRLIFFHWLDGGVVEYIFGFGFESVSSYLGTAWGHEIFAHSDWLEILHDFGLIGISLFTFIHVRLLSIIRRSVRQRLYIMPALVMGYAIFALSNIYSGVILFPKTIMLSLVFAYSYASIRTGKEIFHPYSNRRGLT